VLCLLAAASWSVWNDVEGARAKGGGTTRGAPPTRTFSLFEREREVFFLFCAFCLAKISRLFVVIEAKRRSESSREYYSITVLSFLCVVVCRYSSSGQSSNNTKAATESVLSEYHEGSLKARAEGQKEKKGCHQVSYLLSYLFSLSF